jgi:hypothetical protein
MIAQAKEKEIKRTKKNKICLPGATLSNRGTSPKYP